MLQSTTYSEALNYELQLPDLFSRVLLPFCHPLAPFSRRFFALFSPSKSALFCGAKGTAQSLKRGQFQDEPHPKSSGRKFLPEICREKRSVTVLVLRGFRGASIERCRHSIYS